MAEQKTPLQEEKENKSADIIENNTSAADDETKPKQKKKKPGRPKGSGKKKATQPEPGPFDEQKSLQEGMFLAEMIENVRKGMGITKPLPELTKNTFISSIPAMEQKYGSAVSKYMPEMMFFGSLSMIGFDTFKELSEIKKAEKIENARTKSESEKALNATTVANTIALLNGTSILRVHDVKEGKECLKLSNLLVSRDKYTLSDQ